MYSRGRIYGGISGLACWHTILRHSIISRPPYPAPLQWGPLRSNHFDYQGSIPRLSHAAAVEEERIDGQDTKPGPAIPATRRVSNPSLRVITFDQAQHDLGVESRETWERERYSDLIASLLPTNSLSQPNEKRSQKTLHGTNKKDKLFVNKLLKDKGPHSYNWRIALLDLLRHTKIEEVENIKDIETLDHAPSVVPSDGSHNLDVSGSNEDQIPKRRVASRSRNHRSFLLARDIPPPTEWSKANLAVYVEALAESQRTQDRVPWAKKPLLKDWNNIGDIVTTFERIFYSTALLKCLSIEACNTALRFFYDYGMMTKARELYIRMEDLKMRVSTETFNILLRGSASQKDLHNFTFLLNNMTRRGFKPNEVTWAHFLQVIELDEVRGFIVRKMAGMNMLNHIGIRRDVANHMVHYEIADHLDKGHDHHSFLDHMNSKYGIGWISTSSGNKLLNEVAKRKSTIESLSLLYEMKHAGFMPDDLSMSSLLRHCLPSRQHHLAVEILDIFKRLYGLNPGPEAYETLFLQAWRSRLLNFSTVIWRSACIYGAVSPKVQSLVFESLLSYTPTLDSHIQWDKAEYSKFYLSAKFKKFAGRLVIGLDDSKEAAVSQAVDTLESDPERKTIKWAQHLLRTSLQVSRTVRLKDDFSQLLRQALTMDKTWLAQDLYRKDDWRELFPHAIDVDVRAIAVDVKVKKVAPTQASTALAKNFRSRPYCHSPTHEKKRISAESESSEITTLERGCANPGEE